MKTQLYLVALLVLTASSAYGDVPTINREPVPPEQRAREVSDMKWGMFICWSFSTFSGREWTSGIEDIAFFRATTVDTDQWARTARDAEMGYILFLTKHHDGFCLWDTQTTDRKVTNAPLGRDVLAELRQSCDKYGIKLALYFSEGDWTWPGAVDGTHRRHGGGGFNPDMKKAQLEELLTGYGPIEFIWFDHAINDGGLSHADTVAWCKQFQPNCLIGFNSGEQAGDIQLRERGHPGPVGQKTGVGVDSGDPDYDSYLVAEFTYPILPGGFMREGGADWFYSLPEHDDKVLPAEQLYQDYLSAVEYGNIFSINVGPNYEGRIRDIDVQTLQQVGRWIRGEESPPEPNYWGVKEWRSGVVPVRRRLAPVLSSHKPAKASSAWSDAYAPEKAFDDDTRTRWAAEPNSRSGWLEVDLGKETRISKVVIMEMQFPRTEHYRVEVKEGDIWKTIAEGEKIGGIKTITFPDTIARYVRLNILKANEVPTLEEFRVIGPEE